MSEGALLDRRRRRRRLWALVGALVLAAALAGFVGLEASGCLSPALDLSVSIRNTGDVPLRGLSLDQRDGAGHAIIPEVEAGRTVSIELRSDEHFGLSRIDLVDDITGRNYALPPTAFSGALHGTIDVQASRAAGGAAINGRARSRTDSGADPDGWIPLRVD